MDLESDCFLGSTHVEEDGIRTYLSRDMEDGDVKLAHFPIPVVGMRVDVSKSQPGARLVLKLADGSVFQTSCWLTDLEKQETPIRRKMYLQSRLDLTCETAADFAQRRKAAAA